MTDGSESKVISFTVDSDLIQKIKTSAVVAIQMGDYVSDLYILPSLLNWSSNFESLGLTKLKASLVSLFCILVSFPPKPETSFSTFTHLCVCCNYIIRLFAYTVKHFLHWKIHKDALLLLFNLHKCGLLEDFTPICYWQCTQKCV